MAETNILYLNGLGDGNLRRRERAILNRTKSLGFNVVTANINWRSPETYEDLEERVLGMASHILESMSASDSLIVEGSSAGGMLAFNLVPLIEDSRVKFVSHSGRLRRGVLSRFDLRTLERCAHLGTKVASKSFHDGVLHFEHTTAPSLTAMMKQRMLVTKQWFDEIVPISTMTEEGVPTISYPVLRHAYGIGIAMLLLPRELTKRGWAGTSSKT